jgi:hypothetical protein
MTEVAEYVIVTCLVLYPQVDGLPVQKTLCPSVVGGIIGINGYVGFQTTSSVLAKRGVDKFEIWTEVRLLDCANLWITGMRVGTPVMTKERTNASSFCETEEWGNGISFAGRSVDARGMNSDKNKAMGIGPTKFSHASLVISG